MDLEGVGMSSNLALLSWVTLGKLFNIAPESATCNTGMRMFLFHTLL